MPLTPPYTDGSYPPATMQFSTAKMGQAFAPRQDQYGSASDISTKQYLSNFPMGPYDPPIYSGYNDRPSSTYGASTGTARPQMLPPIQTRENFATEKTHMQSQIAKPTVPPKEEKPIGGVAAHLDYEMEQMVDFVSDAAQGMYDLYHSRICLADIDIARSVNPNVSVSSAFRKYVSQVLTSTRLPSSTILYGMYYLGRRMTELSRARNYPKGTTGTGQVYRMLTTALLLGSKFLDDNTFQNRSWSEVSNIPVAELNSLELDWLKSIAWNLHVDLDHPDGFRLWEAKWKSYQAKKIELSLASLKLSPMNPNLQRQTASSKYISPTSPYSGTYYESTIGANPHDRLASQWQMAQYENSYDRWLASTKSQYSPPSAPHTGPTTPEWYGKGWYGNEYRSYGSSEVATPASAQSFQSFAQQATYQKSYSQQYNQPVWSGHNSTCSCGYCVPAAHDHFHTAYQYQTQTVAG